jgi:hypothetical protein
MDQYDVLLGVLMPIVVGLLTKASMTDNQKSLVALAVAIVATVVKNAITGTLIFTNMATTLTTLAAIYAGTRAVGSKYLIEFLGNYAIKDKPGDIPAMPAPGSAESPIPIADLPNQRTPGFVGGGSNDPKA